MATAPDYAKTVKASPRVELIVKRNSFLKFVATANKFIVADGKPVQLSVSQTSAFPTPTTWDWYVNDEIIPNTTNMATINHSNYGDAVYYVSGKSTDVHFLDTPIQSNVLFIRGVIAVEELGLSITGPNSAGLGERITFKANLIDLDPHQTSNTLTPSDYIIEWYRDGEYIGQGEEIRIYSTFDADGDYTYQIHSKLDYGIFKTSPIHKFTVREENQMVVTLPQTVTGIVGNTVTLTPTIEPTPEMGAIIKYQWFKNGETIVGETSATLTLANASRVDSGLYTVYVEIDGFSPAVSSPALVTINQDGVDPIAPIEGDWYIHDLRPGRDHGFTWVGWWVLDEIQEALNDGFDWIADPENVRFTYPKVLKALADNKNTWSDIEIQESRNGYILLLSDLVA